MTTEWNLYDYDTGDKIRQATIDEIEASDDSISQEGTFCIDGDDNILREDEHENNDRRVYVA